ncbi:CHAT domain-containing protein [Saccharothrix sp. AJ9571]|nr:CHAT domain-containing protein [Saccharothrix sp. AJ9571]
MIGDLLGVLAAAGLSPTPDEVRDALWLCQHIDAAVRRAPPVVDAPSARATADGLPDVPERSTEDFTSPEPDLPDAPEPANDVTSPAPDLPDEPERHANDVTSPETAPGAASGEMYAAAADTAAAHRLRGLALRSPAVPALRDQLDLARALRSFGRRVPGRRPSILDEDATIARIADEGLWLPVLRPAPERWLGLTLVMDVAPSMAVWQQTLAEFRALTEWLGVFRDVRVHTFDSSVHGELPDTLADTEVGRSTIVVVTDAIGAGWYSGRVDPLLRTWGRRAPTAVVTVLPQRMWPGIAVRTAADEVRVPEPGARNASWLVRGEASVPIPVFELSARWLALWTGTVTGAPGLHRVALLGPPTGGRAVVAPTASRNPRDLVRRFRSVASPTAFRLASYLSAAWLTLPVMRLVQRVMLPESSTAHLSEVFLSGLLRQRESNADPEHVEYDFESGVRDELNGYLLRDDALTVLSETSRFVSERLGQPFDFAAMLADPEGVELPAVHGDSGQPMAYVAASVLARLGGRYRVLAERLTTEPVRALGAVDGARPRPLETRHGPGELRTSPVGDIYRRYDDSTAADLGKRAIEFLRRYERTKQLGILDEAIGLFRAVAAEPLADHFHYFDCLSSLGNALQARFEQTGDLANLDEAVEVGRRAVRVIPYGRPRYFDCLSSLGNALQARFEQTGDLANLDEAVDIGRRAVRVIPYGHPRYFDCLSSLGNALQARFEQTGDLANLDEAVDIGRHAVRDIPYGHPRYFDCLSSLGNALQARFEQTGDLANLDEAVDIGRHAVRDIPYHHPRHGECLFNLGNALQARFERTREAEVVEECRRRYADASAVKSSPADVRVMAAHGAADMDLVVGDAVHALAMAERAVHLLPLLAPRRQQRSDRRHRRTRLASLASTVAAAAVAAGYPDRAVELLEQTRSLLFTDPFDIRSELTALRQHAPSLADKLTDVRDVLDTLDHSNSTRRPKSRYREQLLAEWTQLLAKIRAIPAFADFLRPLRIHQLQQAARDGPIVYLVTHAHASHALILNDKAVRAVHLPDLTPDNAVEHVAHIGAAHATNRPGSSKQHRITARERLRHSLAWIWDTITEPVLSYLGHTSTPRDDEARPRIWWCPVGLITYLPLHAAGRHPTISEEITAPVSGADTVLDRVISSYTLTTRALRHTHASTTTPRSPRMLIITVPGAPGTNALPGVTTEVDHLHKLVPDIHVLPAPGDSTRDTVMTALPRHDIAHFACHQTHPLTANHITALHLTGAQLAYLSSCSTTDTNSRHTDEATHLTAAFQLAGYRAVIGTLWPVNDHAAANIATAFYRYLTHGGTTPPDTNITAQALNHAIRNQRNHRPHLPEDWVAYVHIGH